MNINIKLFIDNFLKGRGPLGTLALALGALALYLGP